MTINEAFAEYHLSTLLTSNETTALNVVDFLCHYKPGVTTLEQALTVIPRNYPDVFIQHRPGETCLRLTPDLVFPILLLFPDPGGVIERRRLGNDPRSVTETVSANNLCNWAVLIVRHWIKHGRVDVVEAQKCMQTFALSDINECNVQSVFLLATKRLFADTTSTYGFDGTWGVAAHLVSYNGIGRLCTTVAHALTSTERQQWCNAAEILHHAKTLLVCPCVIPVLALAAYEIGLPAKPALLPHHRLMAFVYLAATEEGQQQLELWRCMTSDTDFNKLPAAARQIWKQQACRRQAALPPSMSSTPSSA
jgi:hypothetical protein